MKNWRELISMTKLALCGSILLWLTAASAQASVTDAPHNETNDIRCNSCHTYSFWWQYSPAQKQSAFAALVYTLCNGCHNNTGNGPQVLTHSSEVIVSTNHGSWERACTACHNPHYQDQLTWAGSDPNLYLVTGTITEVSYNSSSKQTTITYNGATTNANWPAIGESAGNRDWANKSPANPDRGLILVQDTVKTSSTFPIVAATASQVTVKGELTAAMIDPNSSDPVTHQPNSATCNSFGLIYGDLIRNSINSKSVKFFDPNGGFVREEGSTPTGICQVCHSETTHYTNDGTMPAGTDTHVGRNDTNCTTCHHHETGFKGDGHDNFSFVWAGNCATCHNPSGESVNITTVIHGGQCGLCHVNAAGGGARMAGDPSNGIDGSALDATNSSTCVDCHLTKLGLTGGTIHHLSKSGYAAAGNCSQCHQNATGKLAANHMALVAMDSNCTTTCHPGTAGTASGMPVSLTDAAVHDSCRTCHTFDANNNGILVNFTNHKGVNGALDSGLPGGGGACTVCHTVAVPTTMATLGVLHHASSRVAQGQCEYCHADPMPSWSATAPGDNGTSSGSAWPTQMACRECHVSFSGSAMTVKKYTRSDYANYATDWTRTTAHTLPVTGTSINNYGICLSCHFVGSTKVPASAQVTVWHARPDKHGGSAWTFYNQTSAETLGKSNSRSTCGNDNIGHYLPGRSSSGIGGFNIFAPNYGLYQGPNGTGSYLYGTGYENNCGDISFFSAPRASAPFIRITLPAPLPQLGITSPQAVPVFAGIAPTTVPPPAADVINVSNAVWDGINLNVTATTSGACAKLTVWSLPDNTNQGTMTGTTTCTKSIPVDSKPSTINVIPSDGVNVTGFPVADNSALAVTLPTATAIVSTTATLGAEVTVTNGAAITGRGTVWGTAANPTANAVTEGGTATGTFSQARTGLPAGTKIYYRGYATNSVGPSYSASGSFYTEPATQAAGVTFSSVGSTAMTVNWTRGNGDGVIVLMKQGTAATTAPVDGTYTAYSANAVFGSGTQIDGSSVVYKGPGTSVAVTGLTASTTYYLAVYEYKGTEDTSGLNQGTNYKPSPATNSQATGAQGHTATFPVAHMGNCYSGQIALDGNTIWAGPYLDQYDECDIDRTLLMFETSSLGAGATVTSATLYLDYQNSDYLSQDAVTEVHESTWDASADTTYCNNVGSYLNNDTVTTNQSFGLTPITISPSYISKTGSTKFAVKGADEGPCDNIDPGYNRATSYLEVQYTTN